MSTTAMISFWILTSSPEETPTPSIHSLFSFNSHLNPNYPTPTPVLGNQLIVSCTYRFAYLGTFHRNGIIQYVIFYDQLFSLSIRFPKLIHLTRFRTSFLFMDKLFHFLHIKLLIHSLADGCLNYFHLVSTTNNVVMNIHVQVIVLIYVFLFLGFIPMNRITMLCNLRACHTIFQTRQTILRFPSVTSDGFNFSIS